MNAIFERCRAKGDYYNLGDSKIYAKKLMHPTGIVFVYYNDSADKVLRETMQVELNGSFEIEY